MGASATKVPRVVLETDVQLYFRGLHVEKEVPEILQGWFGEGAPLGLTTKAFGELLQPSGCSEQVPVDGLFQLFDTDGNGKADAFEVLAAAIVLAAGDMEDKLDAIFPVFDFAGDGRFNFDEVNILLHSISHGISKVCRTPRAVDQELVDACRQMFDAHNIPYDKQITKDQVKRWFRNDVEAIRLIEDYQGALSLPQIEAQLAAREEAQAAAYAQLCGEDSLAVPSEDLLYSESFRQALGNPSVEAMRTLVSAMAGVDGAAVPPQSFTLAARAWNAFTVFSPGGRKEVSAKELPTLVSLRDLEPATEGSLRKMRKALGLGGNPNQELPLAAWLAVSLQAASH